MNRNISHLLLNSFPVSTEQIAQNEMFDLNKHMKSKNEQSDINFSSLDSKLSDVEEKVLIFIFLTVIIFGFFGNFLVIWTILLNKNMRTSNNLFILNLAVSDLTLCVFSIPFNVYKTLRHTWIFGSFLCKFAPFFQASNVYVSTISITVIALDRYLKVVCSTRIQKKDNLLGSFGSMIFLCSIWFFSFLLSSPLIFFNRIETLQINLEPSLVFPQANYSSSIIKSNSSEFHHENSHSIQNRYKREEINDFNNLVYNINHCIENSPFIQSRLIYSYVSFLIQYTLPILLVALAYGNIWWKLKKHRNKLKKHHKESRLGSAKAFKDSSVCLSKISVAKKNNNTCESQNEKRSSQTIFDKKRRLKMNLLLAFIAIIFAASWLPLNIFNILSDSKNSIIKADHTFYIVNAVCILFGMSSAVSNPILYGVLNENFKREYVRFFNRILHKISLCFGRKQTHNPNSDEWNSFSKYEDQIALEKPYESNALVHDIFELKEHTPSIYGKDVKLKQSDILE